MQYRNVPQAKLDGLSAHEIDVLEGQVLPTSKRWIETYPKGGNMYGHAEKTLRYWGVWVGA
jgi:hypothetical protein